MWGVCVDGEQFYEDYREAIPNWRWPHFTPFEMRCRGRGCLLAVSAFLDRLEALREEFAKPMAVTSGYRSPEHNLAVSSTGSAGPHTTGRAVDIGMFGRDAYRLISLAPRHGFTGIGVKQHGQSRARFVHLDDLPDALDRPRPRLWSYAA